MTIRSQGVDPNSAVLFSSLKTTVGSTATAAPVYSLPIDEDGFGGEEKGGSSGKSQEAGNPASNIALFNKGTLDAPEIGAFSSESSFNPLVLPMSYGGALVSAFLSMIDYLSQASQQNYEVTVSTAQGMIGTDGQNGLIASWVQAGMDAAKAQGEQIMFQAIGSLASAVVSGVSVSFMAGGFIRNCTDGIGTSMFQTNRGKLGQELQDASNYRNLLDQPSKKDLIAQAKTESIIALDPSAPAKPPRTVNMDNPVTRRKQELIEGVEINNYGNNTAKDTVTKDAAQHLSAEERITAKEKADKRKESVQGQIDKGDSAQYGWVQFLNAVTQAGTSAGQAYGGMTSQEQAIIAGEQNTTKDAVQQSAQTTDRVKEDATSKAQSIREQMGQMAQAIAQALAALVKG